jgi:P27 family predicted phage terminase small subunit
MPSLSTEEMEARGSWRAAHRKKHAAESKVVKGWPDTPPDIAANEELLAIWRKVCGSLESIGVLTAIDEHAIARYVHLQFRYQRATNWIVEHGCKTVTPTGVERTATEATEAESCANQLLRLDKEFGLTPAARRTINFIKDGMPIAGTGDDDGPSDAEILGIVG